MDDLEMLKLILRESDSPFFSDEQLQFYAEDDSIALPGGLSLPNNKEYWLRLAKKYRPNGSKIL